jgi:hypothetical protein
MKEGGRLDGPVGFPHLPFQAAVIKSIVQYAAEVAGSSDTLPVVGIGGGALGMGARLRHSRSSSGHSRVAYKISSSFLRSSEEIRGFSPPVEIATWIWPRCTRAGTMKSHSSTESAILAKTPLPLAAMPIR